MVKNFFKFYINTLRERDKGLIKPWLSKNYTNLFLQSQLRLSRERAYVLLEIVNYIKGLEGNFAELGVYRGSTAYLIASQLEPIYGKKLYLFDTFYGTPATSVDDNYKRQGKYSDVDINKVKDFLKLFQEFTIYCQGIIPDTLEAIKNEKLCFVHIHLNIYQSTQAAIELLYDKVVPGGIILIEDYGLKSCAGVKKAIDQFVKIKNIKVIHLPTGQGMIYKL